MTSSNSPTIRPKILITGATSGIGKAVSKRAIKHGYDLIVLGRNSKLIDALMVEIKQINPQANATYYQVDFLNLDEVRLCCEAILRDHSAIDYLYLNAGMIAKKTHHQDHLHPVLKVNYFAHNMLVEKLLPLLKNSQHKTILYTTSMSAMKNYHEDMWQEVFTYAPMKAYAFSKMVMGIALYHYQRLHPDITFKIIDPGIVYTQAVKSFFPSYLFFLVPLARLISKSPQRVSKDVFKVIENSHVDGITYFKQGNIFKEHPIYLNRDVQAHIMQMTQNKVGEYL